MRSSTITDSSTTLYRRASQRNDWKEQTYRELLARSDFSTRKLTWYRWASMLAYYHSELLNFPGQKEDLFAGLVAFTCKKTGLATEEVVKLFSSVDQKVAGSRSKKPPTLDVTGTEFSQVKLVSCDKIRYEISKRTWDELGNDEHFFEVFLNYSFLNPESGLFWSMIKKAYDIASYSGYGIQALECFASPFNYNLKSFCSVFSVDRLLKYPDGVKCYGDFFTYIQLLKERGPFRLIVNPPYTDRIIDRVADELVSYMEAQPDGEFVAMLPDWTPQIGIEKLLALEGSVSHHFASREFCLFDAVHQKMIKPVGMKLLIIVNLGDNKEKSQTLLDELVSTIKTCALRLQ